MAELLAPTVDHRQAVVLYGAAEWAREHIADALLECPSEDVLWLGSEAPDDYECVPSSRFREYLGRERGALVYDAHRGFHPDVFAALLGTLRGGGVLYLLLPEGHWPDDSDPALERLAPWPFSAEDVGRRFFQRLQGCIQGDQAFAAVRQINTQAMPLPTYRGDSHWSLTPEQVAVAEAIERVALGHARRPVVLTADRGRGKSTAIGAALARLLRLGRRVVICAPSLGSIEAVLQQLERELPEGKRTENRFFWGEGLMHYRAPSVQLEEPLACDLLVVDEAAAIGLAGLQQLMGSHNRLVFSTTVHGYEGSGRGFVLRFVQMLRQAMPGTREFTLQTPVRWVQGDALERWLNATFLLEAEPRPVSGSGNPRYEWVDQVELGANEQLLSQVFGLLVAAHYQTRPSDLQQLLDAPGIKLLVAIDDGAVVGVLLAVVEGGFDRALAAEVAQGQRRPRGHLLLQSLAQHAGWCDAPILKAMRVMRIAVLEDLRRQGIGSALLAEAERYAGEADFDLMGTSFGLDESLLPFWQRAGYQVVRIGQRVDPASGAHSAQLTKGLGPAGKALTENAQAAFCRDLPWRLQREFSGLSAGLLVALLRSKRFAGVVPDGRDLENVRAFALERRGYADVYPSLWRWLLDCLSAVGGDVDPVLIRQVLQRPYSAAPDRAEERALRAEVARCLGAQGGG